MTVLNRIEAAPRATWTPVDLVWIVRVLLAKWWVVAAGGLAGLVAMFGVLMITQPRYDVTAKVFVRLGREMTAPPVLGMRDSAQIMPASKRPEDAASEVEILTNPLLLKRTVEHFGTDFFLGEAPDVTLWQKIKRVPKEIRRVASESLRGALVMLGLRPETTPLERVTLGIASGLSVEPVRKSDVIEVKLSYPDPRSGELFLAKFLEFALESHVEAYRSTGTRQFFANEQAGLAAELKQAEQRLLAARSSTASSWSGPEQRALLMKAEADLQLQQIQALAEAAQASAEIAQSRATLEGLSREITLSTVQLRNKATDELAARLQQLTLELVALRARYAEGSPEVSEIQRQIDHVRAAIAAEPSYRTDGITTGPNQQYESVLRDLIARENQRQGQQARAAEIASQLGRLREQIRAVQVAEIEIAQAEREVTRLRRSVDLHDKGLEEARIAEAMDAAEISNLKVIMPPTAGLLPSAPSLTRYLLIGLAGGLTLAAGLVILRALLARSAARAAGLSGAMPPPAAL